MKKAWKAALVAVALGVAPACSRADASSTRERAHQMVEGGARLVDVRTPQEFAEGHLPGAVNIPLDQLERRVGEIGAPDTKVVLYCRTGRRSAQAEGLLRARGFQDVLNLGGMSAW